MQLWIIFVRLFRSEHLNRKRLHSHLRNQKQTKLFARTPKTQQYLRSKYIRFRNLFDK